MTNMIASLLFGSVLYPQLGMKVEFADGSPTYVLEEFFVAIKVYNPTQEVVEFVVSKSYFAFFPSLTGCGDVMKIVKKATGEEVRCAEIIGGGLGGLREPMLLDTVFLSPGETLTVFMIPNPNIGGRSFDEPGTYVIEEVRLLRYGKDTLVECAPNLEFYLKDLEPEVKANLAYYREFTSTQDRRERQRRFLENHPDHPKSKSMYVLFGLWAFNKYFISENKDILLAYARNFPVHFILSGTLSELERNIPEVAEEVLPILEEGLSTKDPGLVKDIWDAVERVREFDQKKQGGK